MFPEESCESDSLYPSTETASRSSQVYTCTELM